MISQLRDFTGWKYYKDIVTNQNIGICIVYPDGKQSAILLIDPDVAKWLEAGNTPEPAEENQ